MNIEQFIIELRKHGIELSNYQIQQFERYYELLIEWNEKINLTAITEKDEVYLKHFFDSIMLLWELPLEHYQQRLVDVGAGAGFPSIPLKIVKPELEITIIDSLNKRINFLNIVSEELQLDNVQAIHARAEDAGQNPVYREQFDIATARAVASLNVLSEFCLPLVRKGGYFLALKAAKGQEELDDAQKAIHVLGAKLEEVKVALLPVEDSERTFIKIRKTLETQKKYPRKAGKPIKQPIK
ncbi:MULTISPECIES: 16S rRNA (guanine(527)-N(7))-methyltransferase RsmG [unclassified Facklamia]|uniref:16S rRNA (guanine(527)-N(7))-methyltransferase RsmG n=1 Tax=Aerococcaceae TaxID=186827 RepID=UPI0013B9B814|nr:MULTISPECIES: 16S rRNA (guanine(527)-N(7))-methyltransferase RsmG [unclassified Facklamia]NEW65109.1 16S rRNA (guanine(527)-N(7))-methyltransferase RsmG [Facklamia sp. 252]NEW68639.1 16S rRNA (guanine(527)-N(7))-methyltransferase RsmG [Facklamia sp. 253]QQD65506.1 16S rRNA (guanine(527)-N(7))-methyltransferase RsmG [Aerococcaceae bacterium zg-252]